MGSFRLLAYMLLYTVFMTAKILGESFILYLHVRAHVYRVRRRMLREFRKALAEAGLPKSLARQLSSEYSVFLSRNYRIPGMRDLLSIAWKTGCSFKAS
ncbi:MAG: hypothetical protein F7C07_04725 [Desulfurococcales archaeon]|nr:hypothetical protein [Desulfurococcales archaeon]